MPSLPTRYPSTSPPSRDNGHLNSSDTMSSEETLDETSISSLTNNTLPMSSTSTKGIAMRPPLPPNCNHHKKLTGRNPIVGNSNFLVRSPSPSCSVSSASVSYRARSLSGMRSPSVASSRSRRSQLDSFSIPPRRTYPCESTRSPSVENALIKEQAPVVFDASLNFVLGCERQRVKQSFRPTASHLEPSTASSYLSSKISQFLKRTDHIMDEWRSLGHNNEADDDQAISVPHMRNKSRDLTGRRSQSATNIMIRGYQYYSRSNSVGKSPSRRSMSRGSEDATLSDGIQEVT